MCPRGVNLTVVNLKQHTLHLAPGTGKAGNSVSESQKIMILVGLERTWSHNEASTLTTLIAAHLHILKN